MKFYLYLFTTWILLFLSAPFFILGQDTSQAPSNTSPSHSAPPLTNNSIDSHSIASDMEKQDRSPEDVVHPERESDTFQAKFFNMLFILGLLIGFMLLASWALKRIMRTKMTQLNSASTIKVLETRYLSPRATLYLIEVQDQTFLIAESPTSVTPLALIPTEQSSTAFHSSPNFSKNFQTS